MAKLGHVITPWPNGLGSNFGWFSETSNHALSRWRHYFLPYFIPSWSNLGSKKWRFCKKTHFFPRFWWRHNDVIRRSQIFLNYPKPQFRSRSWKPVVAISPISFTFLNISVSKLVINYHARVERVERGSRVGYLYTSILLYIVPWQ